MRRLLTLALGLLAALTFSLPLTAPAHAGEAWVEKAQKRLNGLGCNSGPVDGVLGTWTRAAVLRFQSRHAMTQTGKLTADVRTKLYAKAAKRCDARPVPKGSGTGRRIVLSQRQNWIWLVQADGTIARQGGMIDNPAELSRGTYRTGSYCGRAARIPRNITASGDLYMDNFVRFAPCGIGFHRIPTYVDGGGQIHADYLLGTNYRTSHGCIRLQQGFAKRLWDFTTGATKVVVV